MPETSLAENTLTVMLVENQVQVNTDSLGEAARSYQQIADWLRELCSKLALIETTPTLTGELIAGEITHLWQQINLLQEKATQLSQRFQHGKTLYEIAENHSLTSFQQARGMGVQNLLHHAQPLISAGVFLADVVPRSFKKFAFRQVCKTITRLKKPRSYLIFALIDFSLPMLLADSYEAYQQVQREDSVFLRNSNSPVERIAARLARLNLEQQTYHGKIQANLQVAPVSESGMLLEGVVLNRWTLMEEATPIPQLIPRKNWEVPSLGIVATPLTVSALLQRTKTVRDHPHAKTATHRYDETPRSGEIEVIRHSTQLPSGKTNRSYTIVLKGTQDFSLNSQTPHDMQTNLQAAGSLRNDISSAAQAALEMVGAKPGEAVELVGHSQGGLVSAELAGEAEFNNRYRVVGVATAGSPIAENNLLDTTNVISFEHLGDPVPALDTKINPNRSNWLTYSVNGELANPPGNITGRVDHSVEGYIAAAQQVEAQPDTRLSAWLRRRRELMQLTERTKSEVFRFAITRQNTAAGG